ncbi:MAG: MATE family efflux transporter [Devosia sp.]
MSTNPYLRDSIPRTFLKTALPIILLTSVNGLLTVVDAIFLGAFVGPDALTAVTLMFPISMLLVALATTVSTGMTSVLARHIGAGQFDDARRVFAGAHGLSLTISIILMALFAAFGWPLIMQIAGGSQALAEMGHLFLSISIYTTPIGFLLILQSDALRSEGRVGFMAITGLLVSLANMAFNYGFIVWAGLGVAGSALGTALAQVLVMLAILIYRAAGKARLNLALADARQGMNGWGRILALGAPRSLSFLGIALGSAAVITALRVTGVEHYDSSIAAYGVITRIMTFAFFPLLGMSLALQAMVGNNFGAGQWARSNASLKLALVVALSYSALVETGLMFFRNELGGLFVADPAVRGEVARILPIYVACYFSFGPMMMIASYFQAIGDAKRSAILSLARTYLFAIPLTFALPLVLGDSGIWLAAPIADVLVLLVTGAMLAGQSRTMSWGLFKPA